MELNLRQHCAPALASPRTRTVLATLRRLFCLGLLLTLGAASGQAQTLAAFTASPLRVASGQRITCIATLSAPAPYYKPGDEYHFSVGKPTWVIPTTSNPAVTSMLPATLVASYSTQASFYVVTAPVTVETPVVLTAACNGVSISLTVTLVPFVPPTLKTLSTAPASITGGKNAVGTVSVNNLIPVNTWLDVALSSSNPTIASVPVSVRIDWFDENTGASDRKSVV